MNWSYIFRVSRSVIQGSPILWLCAIQPDRESADRRILQKSRQPEIVGGNQYVVFIKDFAKYNISVLSESCEFARSQDGLNSAPEVARVRFGGILF